ncbi:MAG: alpha/beta fold hydrolase [Candidatus Helarchaeota archaeon]|nr:alpha/beta fold hydrolase [Candidatus Helarchaeota archaeon]
MKLRIPENVLPGAEPFYLKGSNTGVLLIHGGGGGTTSDMRELGQFIHKETGYTVLAPLLPGYGTTKEDLAKTTYKDWINAVKQNFLELKSEVKKIFVVGHSMGGVLTLLLGSEFPSEITGIVSISAPTKIKGFLIKLVPFFLFFVKYCKIIDIEAFKELSNGIWTGYEQIPLKIVGDFHKLMKLSNAQLNRIVAPILIIQGHRDEFVPAQSPVIIHKTVKSSIKTIRWFNSDHAILFSKVKLELFSYIVEFIRKY